MQNSYKECFEIEYALETLNDYILFHKDRNVVIESSVLKLINETVDSFAYKIQYTNTRQYIFTREEFFKNVNSSFDKFATSRHTCRNYSDKEIPDEVFNRVAEISKNSPSSCNRQPCKFYVIKDKELRNKVLAAQGGNRGFGETASAVIIVTSNLKDFSDVQECQQASINAGFMGMNILYALHYYKIGACVLNWSYTRKKEILMRKLVPQIKDEEQICMLISCGYPADSFYTARSKRKDTACNVTFIH